eukprot:TRINITY_DN2435_c0_g1_i5.p1 TRINITY_DN2435_c0_g1~~TRINITY_DN2435_c0_g1_i5.p1  ORF type:complete len:572 (-),score=160.50 TRINITY_DN2435_c0_g1_i5:82-1797(-)
MTAMEQREKEVRMEEARQRKLEREQKIQRELDAERAKQEAKIAEFMAQEEKSGDQPEEPEKAADASDDAVDLYEKEKKELDQQRERIEKGLPVNLSSHNLLKGLDAEIFDKMSSKQDPMQARRVCKWISDVTDELVYDVYESLKSGKVLCKLINTIRPGIVPKYNLRPIALMERENIQLYLNACEQLGVAKGDLFALSDLHENRNIMSVIQNMYALARLASTFEDYKGPQLRLTGHQRAQTIGRASNFKHHSMSELTSWPTISASGSADVSPKSPEISAIPMQRRASMHKRGKSVAFLDLDSKKHFDESNGSAGLKDSEDNIRTSGENIRTSNENANDNTNNDNDNQKDTNNNESEPDDVIIHRSGASSPATFEMNVQSEPIVARGYVSNFASQVNSQNSIRTPLDLLSPQNSSDKLVFISPRPTRPEIAAASPIPFNTSESASVPSNSTTEANEKLHKRVLELTEELSHVRFLLERNMRISRHDPDSDSDAAEEEVSDDMTLDQFARVVARRCDMGVAVVRSDFDSVLSPQRITTTKHLFVIARNKTLWKRLKLPLLEKAVIEELIRDVS